MPPLRLPHAPRPSPLPPVPSHSPTTVQDMSPERTLNSTRCGAKSASVHRTHWQYSVLLPGCHGATESMPPRTVLPPRPLTTSPKVSPAHTSSISPEEDDEDPESEPPPPPLMDRWRRDGDGGGGARAACAEYAQVLPGRGHWMHTWQ